MNSGNAVGGNTVASNPVGGNALGGNTVASSAADSNVESGLVRFLLRHRLQLSLIVFTGLVAEDFFTGTRPHDVLNVFDLHSVMAVVLIGLGLVLRSWAAGTLHKWKELTTNGPYRLVRNPLYVGSFLMMIGFCVLVDDAENFWVVLGPMLGLYVLKVKREEQTLAKKFGDAWTDYANCTPRMLPRRWPLYVAGEWRWDQWLKNCEYQAVIATLVGLAAIKLWHDGVFHA